MHVLSSICILCSIMFYASVTIPVMPTSTASYMHSLGALVISDEMCTALGRNGTTFWGFQKENGSPDFVCCGKPIGERGILEFSYLWRANTACLVCSFCVSFGSC